jgi:hypothetical protein
MVPANFGAFEKHKTENGEHGERDHLLQHFELD